MIQVSTSSLILVLALNSKLDKNTIHGEILSDYNLEPSHLALPEDYARYVKDKNEFIAQVRKRDRQCCITGELITENNVNGFEVARIWSPDEIEFYYDVST